MLREERNLTQRELAQVVKLSPSTIGMYESGRRDPDSETLRLFADYFGVGVDYLLGRTDARQPAARDDIPPDILEELRALDVDTRTILFRSKKKLSPEGWRTVIEFIKWQLSQEENK